MFKKTVTYTDWNGVKRTEDFYFNLTRTECIELEYGSDLGKSMTDSIKTLIENQDMGVIVKTIKEILLAAYGIKSDDGRRFIKNAEVREAFEQNPAFDIIYMEFATDPDKAADFVTGIMPSESINALGANPKQKVLEIATSRLNNTDE